MQRGSHDWLDRWNDGEAFRHRCKVVRRNIQRYSSQDHSHNCRSHNLPLRSLCLHRHRNGSHKQRITIRPRASTSHFFCLVQFARAQLVILRRLASASRTSSTFQFQQGSPSATLQVSRIHAPVIARADNGDTVSIAGQGSVSIHPKSVTGSGTFVHKAPDGTVKAMGTWTALQLMSFRSWGNSPGLPANFVGGQAIMLVQLCWRKTSTHCSPKRDLRRWQPAGGSNGKP